SRKSHRAHLSRSPTRPRGHSGYMGREAEPGAHRGDHERRTRFAKEDFDWAQRRNAENNWHASPQRAPRTTRQKNLSGFIRQNRPRLARESAARARTRLAHATRSAQRRAGSTRAPETST